MSLVLSPFGPIAGAFYADNSPRAAIVGPFGSAKSVAVVHRILRHAMEQAPGHDGIARTRFLAVRNTFRQLNDTTVRTWREWVDDATWGPFEPTKMRHVLRGETGGKQIECEILFRALEDENDLRNALGAEYTGVWFNEGREIEEKLFSALCARVGRFPAAASGAAPTWSGALLDSNPWFQESYLHDRFLLNPRPGYKLFHQPGGLSPGAENLDNLAQTPATMVLPFGDPKRRARGRTYYLDMERDMSPDEFRIVGCAQFGALRSGQAVYQDYVDSVHCAEFLAPPNAGLIVGIDVGIRASAAVLLHRTPTGSFLVLDEVACFDRDLPGFVAEIRRTLARYPSATVERYIVDPAAGQRQLSGMSAIEMLRAAGLYAIPAVTNSPPVRIGAVGSLLRQMGRDGLPVFRLHPRCTFLRKGFLGGYAFAKGRHGQLADRPGDSDYTHTADALQYAVLAAVGTVQGAMGGDARRAPAWPADGAAIYPAGRTWL
jgi:hypothetical protein